MRIVFVPQGDIIQSQQLEVASILEAAGWPRPADIAEKLAHQANHEDISWIGFNGGVHIEAETVIGTRLTGHTDWNRVEKNPPDFHAWAAIFSADRRAEVKARIEGRVTKI